MSIIDLIGNTPLIDINISPLPQGVRLCAKAEFLNPSGSVKDRAAKNMLLSAIKEGKLTKNKIILDATSGNTGIAYAMIGAALGYKVELCLPANASFERKKILKAYGASIIETDPMESSDGAYLIAKKWRMKTRINIFSPTSTTTTQTGRRITTARRKKYGNKPTEK
jgi:cysteine synthase B